MRHLLIVYHSQSGSTWRLARAALCGARQEQEVETRLLRAGDADSDDLRWADGVLFGSPENFGYLSGGLTDFLARTFYAVQGWSRNPPYAAFISAGNDGRGAVRQLERIVGGYPMQKVAEPVIVRGEVDAEGLARCEELGLTLAAGLAMGIF